MYETRRQAGDFEGRRAGTVFSYRRFAGGFAGGFKSSSEPLT